jgi:hypothetical protein
MKKAHKSFKNVEVEDEWEQEQVEKEKQEKCGFTAASVAMVICTCLQVTPLILWLQVDGTDPTYKKLKDNSYTR